jgi:hypothetical protein
MIGSPITTAPYTIFPTTRNLYYYDESTDDYWTGNNYDAGSTMGWTAFNAGNMTVNKGYLFNYYQTTITFTGQLNKSNAGNNITIHYTDHGGVAPNGTSYNSYDGWELVANPFTSAIDWTVVDAHAANLFDAIYVWDGANATYKSYVVGTDSHDGVGTNGGSQYIPPMQGFFVKINEGLGLGGTLNIPANARVHNSQIFWKDQEYETPKNFLRLTVHANKFKDETVIRFLPEATNSVDEHFDAYKLFSYNPQVPQIYSQVYGTKLEYSINTLPQLSNETIIVPIVVYSKSDNFSITVDEMNFPNAEIYLRRVIDEDNEFKLKLSQEYKFVSNGADYQYFELVVVPFQTTSLEFHENLVKVVPNPSSGKFDFVVQNSQKLYTLIITDITGKIIYQKTSDKPVIAIDLSSQSKGIYLAKIKMQDEDVIYKKIIIR